MTNLRLCFLFLLGACAVDAGTEGDDPTIDDLEDGKTDAAPIARMFYCHTTDVAASLVKVRLVPNDSTFDVEASSAAGPLFSLQSLRPSVNVQIDDGASTTPNEFVDFRASGLETVPAIGTPRLEVSLATGTKPLVFADAASQVQLDCRVSGSKLLAYLGIAPIGYQPVPSARSVGFDIDDTLLFSTPSFTRAFVTGGTPAPTDTLFWTHANRCDAGCAAETITLANGTTKQLPANTPSSVKARVLELVEYHRAHGAEVYAITARPDVEGNALRAYVEAELGIAADHLFFEPDIDQPGNPAGKTDRMQQLSLDVFYGDSDSDITDARKVQGATVKGIRVLRSPKSSNRKDGRLNKYHPGYYGEPIIARSYD